MAVRSIRVFGDPVLNKKCASVAEVTAGVRAHVQDLLDTVNFDGRAGLASTQIGGSLRAFSLNIGGEQSYIINPVLETFGDIVEMQEGCLSLPGLWASVPRYERARVTGYNLAMEQIVIEGEGLLAQALQHECDHLEGKLYISRLQGEDRRRIMRQIRESQL